MKPFILFLFFSFSVSCKKHKVSSFSLTEITFYVTGCNGTCPDISMNIYEDKRIEISRKIFTRKGQLDSTLSGNFKGHLSDEDFKKLIILLEKINWDTLTYSKVLCCDEAVKTISLFYNEKYKRIKSITLPRSTIELADYLTYLATQILVPKYNKPLDFEVYSD